MPGGEELRKTALIESIKKLRESALRNRSLEKKGPTGGGSWGQIKKMGHFLGNTHNLSGGGGSMTEQDSTRGRE